MALQHFGNGLDYFGRFHRRGAETQSLLFFVKILHTSAVQFSFFLMAVGAIPNSAEKVREKYAGSVKPTA